MRMNDKSLSDPFSLTVRLLWIDDMIDEEGQIQRTDIARAFFGSTQQASHDLRRYRELNPGRIFYDPTARAYLSIEGSRPLFTRGQRSAANDIVEAVRELAK